MKETLQIAFGRNLTLHRVQQLEIGRDELAEIMKFNVSYVGALERGEKNLSINKVEEYAELLGLDARYLQRE